MLTQETEKTKSIYQLNENFENGRFKQSAKKLRKFMFKGMRKCWKKHLNEQPSP